MQTRAWYRSGAVNWIAAVLLPPAGIVLLWMRRGTRVWKKLLGSVALAVWSFAALVMFFGLRVELDGSGMRPFLLKFNRPNAHYAELERSRAQQKVLPVAEVTAPAEARPVEAAA